MAESTAPPPASEVTVPPTARPAFVVRWFGALVLGVLVLACVGTLPWTAGRSSEPGAPSVRRFERTALDLALLPPSWAPHREDEARRVARMHGAAPTFIFGTDRFGRDVFIRCLAGGGVSLLIGLAAATVAVVIGTGWGTIAGARGGRVDAAMMRTVDVLYGLPTILLVVLLAVAVNGWLDRAGGDVGVGTRQLVNLGVLVVAIGGVSWLTMARVIRGQVLALRGRPFIEASRAIGVPWRRQFTHHYLPNLVGPVIVYATLAVPSAILAESFLSFLGIGVQAPLPSWGTLVSDGLGEVNPVRVRWWLLLWPSLLIATTLLSLNFVGEALRRRVDPRRSQA
ncbi:MAG: ABC transporter permease [Phycisphaerales bacterium]|nr:ABC transporter permease [Phycisphaerales bacterium]